MSSSHQLNPGLFLTHAVTRSALAEAFIRRLSILSFRPPLPSEVNCCVDVTRDELFEVLVQLDPLVSVLSLDRIWPNFVNLVTEHGNAWCVSTEGYKVRVYRHKVQPLVDQVRDDLLRGVFQGMDARDENLRYLFEEETKPSLPRMDIHGRLMTSADDKLDQLIKILEPISGFMQRAFEEQSIAAIMARQNQLALEDIEKKIEQLSAAQQTTQFVPIKEMTMAERITKAATETGTGVLSAIQEGGKISLSQKANQGVVDLFHKHLGHHIPGATSPVGKKIEAIAIPAILHFGAAAFSDKIPHVDVVQRACLRAITGESKDGMDGMLEVLMPIFREIVASEGIVGEAMKEMARTEVAKVEQAPDMPQLSAHDIQAQALMDSFMEQVKNAKPGEPIEIKLTLPARTEEPRSLVPPFEK